MSVETWKPVVGYEGLYEVSSMGRVKSLGRVDRFNKKWNCRIMKPTYVGKHYQMVRLCKKGKTKNQKVHRLVAEAFIPNPDKKPQVNHIDGNKDNNCADNLEWCTNSENQLHARENGLNSMAKNNATYSIPVDMYTRDGVFVKTFPSMCEAARNTGVKDSNISACCQKAFLKYTAGGFCWKYAEGGVQIGNT